MRECASHTCIQEPSIQCLSVANIHSKTNGLASNTPACHRTSWQLLICGGSAVGIATAAAVAAVIGAAGAALSVTDSMDSLRPRLATASARCCRLSAVTQEGIQNQIVASAAIDKRAESR